MIALTATNQSLEVTTSSTSAIDVNAFYVDHSSTGGKLGSSSALISTITMTQIVGSPPDADTERQVGLITARNTGTAANTVRLLKYTVGSESELFKATLSPGEMIQYSSSTGFVLFDANGMARAVPVEKAGVGGNVYPVIKVGSAKEAAGVWYCYAKDTGYPGAWAPGTPGLAGRATDGTLAADAGCIPVPNAASGSNFITSWAVDSTTAIEAPSIWDVLWVNSGTVVTTVGAQTVNSVALPARDQDGSTNGKGVLAAILVTTATTNAGSIANMTLSYTNSNGVAGRTATMASYPATAVVGTVVFFQLQAGDSGVRSIQSHTLGTSLGAGAVSLLMLRRATPPSPVANVGQVGIPAQINMPGVRLYNGACLLPFTLPANTTASTLSAALTVLEKSA